MKSYSAGNQVHWSCVPAFFNRSVRIPVAILSHVSPRQGIMGRWETIKVIPTVQMRDKPWSETSRPVWSKRNVVWATRVILNSSRHIKKQKKLGACAAQSVVCPTSAQVMISQSVSSSPVTGSVLTAQSLELASDSVSPSLSVSPLLTLCLYQKMNKC